ncbi:hypothetical protein L1987_06372 [Smallanthus sonchifolius]|uniref:Uncharacterized protein n=1 Tax=Smallanthus sonchifolius TaxID=185202 RepID=A0ACB9JYC0_9ASTR|nr:hypothetical protein L1987_06372 [Smallanthus sonchifolius]
MEVDCNGVKRKSPIDGDHLIPADSDYDRPPELVVKSDSTEKADKAYKESIQRIDHRDDGALIGKKESGSKSPYGVAMSVSTHELQTDEKMQKIVNELVNYGLPPIEVGKAAEIFYNDPVKVKVLFALPSGMRRSYVFGLKYSDEKIKCTHKNR